MANICYAMHEEISEQLVEAVKVPTGATLVAGNVLLAETLATGSTTVYEGAQVTAVTQAPVIIVDQKFEQLADGRRPDGSNMVTGIQFRAGEVVHAIRFSKHMKYEIATDVLDTTIAPAVGKFIIPKANSYQMIVADALGTATVGLKIEALETIAVGGNVTGGFSASVIARVVLA